MTPHSPRPLLEVFRSTLRTLQSEPGPMTPDKAEFMEYLHRRIAEHESLDRSCLQTSADSSASL